MTIDISEENRLTQAAAEIISFAEELRIWLFVGDLGAGKTTLIKHIGTELGIVDQISSPTFSLINEYQSEAGEEIYHFDFYRLATENEALNLGLDEYFYSGRLCLIEWPERIPSLIPEQYLKINIKFIADKRIIDLTKHGPEN